MHVRIAATLLAALATGVIAPAHADSRIQPATLTWQPCPSDSAPTKQCAWLTVPRRHDRPQGPTTIRIALARIPATGTPAERIGSLVWDAGGPGGPSTQMVDSMVQRMSAQVRARFDFVAFDPRGIGASRPTLRDCAQPWPVRPAFDPLPAWGSVRKRSAAVLAAANRQCLRDNRRIAAVMGTNNVAADLDLIRAALGDRKLTYWGTSYGTRIGYVYALTHPDRVRAMVMDGSIDPTSGYRGLARIGGLSQDSALAFIRTHDRPAYRAAIRALAWLTADPVRLPDGSRFSRWDWIDVLGDIVAFQDAWSAIGTYARFIEQASVPGEQGDVARTLLTRVKARPNSNEGAGFSMVNCLDYAARLSPAQQARLARDNAARAPITGGTLTLSYAMGCAGLRGLTPDPVPLVTTSTQRARLAEVPVLLANATHDGSTPITWARRMQRVFDRPMIRYRSSQHVIWGATGSRCVNGPIDRFVVDLRMPGRSRTCPFVPSD